MIARLAITNDDGSKSPFLAPLVRSLRKQFPTADFVVAVPAEEQSWIAQAVTRFRPLFVNEIDVAGERGFSVSGTPADAASLAAANLTPLPPEVLISGINIGTNAGLPYYLSSGTVGAARQSFLFGVKSIAYSVIAPREVFHAWKIGDLAYLESLSAHVSQLADICAAMTERLYQMPVWEEIDLFSINLPWEATAETEVVITQLERASYKNLFVEEGGKGRFVHRARAIEFGLTECTDSDALAPDMTTLKQGKISLTPLRYDLVPRDQRALSLLQTTFTSS